MVCVCVCGGSCPVWLSDLTIGRRGGSARSGAVFGPDRFCGQKSKTIRNWIATHWTEFNFIFFLKTVHKYFKLYIYTHIYVRAQPSLCVCVCVCVCVCEIGRESCR